MERVLAVITAVRAMGQLALIEAGAVGMAVLTIAVSLVLSPFHVPLILGYFRTFRALLSLRRVRTK
jgi:hypothetical protein